MTSALAPFEATVDAFLGGRLEAVQPATGYHRSGLEAVLLGAALDPAIAGKIVDLGAGCGVAGFCAAARCVNSEIILAERDPVLTGCARTALERSANRRLANGVRIVEVDITAPEDDRIAAGLPRGEAAAVLINPPFHAASAVSASPAPGRAAAHILEAGFDAWFRAAAWALRPKGVVIAVTLASALPDMLAALAGRFGGAALLPIHPRPDKAAERLMVHAAKGSRAAMTVLPGLVLHGADGAEFRPPIDAILRQGAGLGEVHKPWQGVSAIPS